MENLEKAHYYADALKCGFAIGVDPGNIEDFFNTLKDIEWFILPRTVEFSSKHYFVLFGNRLLYSETPTYGGYSLDVLNY